MDQPPPYSSAMAVPRPQIGDGAPHAQANPMPANYAPGGFPTAQPYPPGQPAGFQLTNQPGQPMGFTSPPDVGFQPAVPLPQPNQPSYPGQVDGNATNAFNKGQPHAYETVYGNPSSDLNPLTPSLNAGDNGSDKFNQFNFDNASIRRAFIKKVYSIVMVQLLVTLSFIALFVFEGSAGLYVERNPATLYAAIGVYFVTAFSMACCEAPRRVTPYNYIFLGAFTLALSFMMGVICARARANEVLMAVGITAAICLALTLFAFQTKWDFTGAGPYLFCIFIPLFLFGIIAAVSGNPTMNMLYAAGGVVLFSCFLVYDTQLMIGGGYKHSISPEDYVFAALNIYLDIMIIFIKILQLLKR